MIFVQFVPGNKRPDPSGRVLGTAVLDVAGSAGPEVSAADVHRVIDILSQRVFYEVVGRTLLRGLVLPLLVALIGVAVLDTNTDWAALRRSLAGLAPWQQSGVFTALMLGWSWQAGRALRPVWRHRTVAFLVRQPIGRVQWAVGLLPSLSIAFVPIAAIWWLAPHRAQPVVHYLAFVGLAWPLVIGASFTGRSSAALLAIGTFVLAALIFSYAHSAAFAYAALLVTLLQIPLSLTWIPRQIAPVHERISGHLRGASVLGTLMRRDLRCAVRVGRKPLANLAVLGIIAAAMMFAFRVNGHVAEREAFLTACVLFSIAASPVYELLEKMKAALGDEIMRRRWPITHPERALALAGVAVVLVGPSAILVALGGFTMGGAYLALFALFVAATVAVCSAVYAQLLIRARSAVGICYLALLGNGVMALAMPAWAYALFAVVTAAAGFVAAVRGFSAFTGRVQRMRFDYVA